MHGQLATPDQAHYPGAGASVVAGDAVGRQGRGDAGQSGDDERQAGQIDPATT
jgi:hypothetical protein